MFEERAERATDPISRQHYREMAAHYRALSIEQTAMREPETAHEAFAFVIVVAYFQRCIKLRSSPAFRAAGQRFPIGRGGSMKSSTTAIG